MTLRVSDEDYLGHVDRWWSVLLPRLSRFLYARGGPIVLTQASCNPQSLAQSPFGELYIQRFARSLSSRTCETGIQKGI